MCVIVRIEHSDEQDVMLLCFYCQTKQTNSEVVV